MMGSLLINALQVLVVCLIIVFTLRLHVYSGEYTIHLANLNDPFVIHFKAQGYCKSFGQNSLQKSVSWLCSFIMFQFL